jgi:hypothetical protein
VWRSLGERPFTSSGAEEALTRRSQRGFRGCAEEGAPECNAEGSAEVLYFQNGGTARARGLVVKLNVPRYTDRVSEGVGASYCYSHSLQLFDGRWPCRREPRSPAMLPRKSHQS